MRNSAPRAPIFVIHSTLRYDVENGRTVDLRHHTVGERGHGVIHLIQQRDMKIANVARNQVAEDLPLSIGDELVPDGEALKDDMDDVR